MSSQHLHSPELARLSALLALAELADMRTDDALELASVVIQDHTLQEALKATRAGVRGGNALYHALKPQTEVFGERFMGFQTALFAVPRADVHDKVAMYHMLEDSYRQDAGPESVALRNPERPGALDLAEFAAHLARARTLKVRGFDTVRSAIENATHMGLRRALEDTLNRMRQGETMEEGMRAHPRVFDPLFVAFCVKASAMDDRQRERAVAVYRELERAYREEAGSVPHQTTPRPRIPRQREVWAHAADPEILYLIGPVANENHSCHVTTIAVPQDCSGVGESHADFGFNKLVFAYASLEECFAHKREQP